MPSVAWEPAVYTGIQFAHRQWQISVMITSLACFFFFFWFSGVFLTSVLHTYVNIVPMIPSERNCDEVPAHSYSARVVHLTDAYLWYHEVQTFSVLPYTAML